jgi:hypothetical protein
VNQGAAYEVTVQLQPVTFQASAVVQYRLSVGNVVYGSGSAPVALIPGRPAQLTFQDCLDCGNQLINLHGQSGTLQITVLDGATAVAHDSVGFFVP